MCRYQACNCKRGFRNVDGKCIDRDECGAANPCDMNAMCKNTMGSYVCRCNAGYQGSGLKCIDIDECNTVVNVCDRIETCQNNQGGFFCMCNGKECHKRAHCSDFGGKVKCYCEDGFMGNGRVCTDIDECLYGTHNCTEKMKCTNIYGGFQCSNSSITVHCSSIWYLITTTLLCWLLSNNWYAAKLDIVYHNVTTSTSSTNTFVNGKHIW